MSDFVAVLLCLGASALWALSSVMLTPITLRIGVLRLNAARCGIAGVVLAVLLLGLGQLSSLTQISPLTWLGLVGSVILVLGIGDSLYYASSQLIGVSRTMPISNAYPLLTLGLAVVLLGEHFTLLAILGTALVVAGVTLVAGASAAREDMEPKNRTSGLVLALIAAVSWSFGVIVLQPTLQQISPLPAGVVRQCLAGLLMGGIALLRPAPVATRPVKAAFGTGWTALLIGSILGNVVSSLMWLQSISVLGASRTSTLTATSPLFAAPLAFLVLGEHLNSRVAWGTVVSVIGVALVVST